ncbi:MAG: methyltransferase domain-containing protein [Rhodocyclaceae bacterium]|nr:methyltransferase domain-containing protein [Rhodocyclaceae bacterium]
MSSSASPACRICDTAMGGPLLVQHDMPAAAQGLPTVDRLDRDRGVELRLHQCPACGLAQLANAPVPYYREVIRAAGISPEMQGFRRDQFRSWLEGHGLSGGRILEVGCGRGEYLAILGESGADAVGLEYSAEAADACRAAGLNVETGFIEGPESRLAGAPFDGFVILNFLEHLPAADRVLRGIAAQLRDGGIGMVEVPNFDMILERGLFAEFIPDHLFYFTRATLSSLLERNGFEVLSCSELWHGYLLSATVRRRRPLDISGLTTAQAALGRSFADFLDRFDARRVAVWGAGHQALALISLLGIKDRLAYVVDSAPFKQGRFTPATHLPIMPPERLEAGDVDAVIVLAASYSDEVARIIAERHGDRFTIARLEGDSLQTLNSGPRP